MADAAHTSSAEARLAQLDPFATRRSVPSLDAFEVVKAAGAAGKPRFVISTEQVDLVGDIVVQAGLSPVSDRIPAQVDHSGKMRDLIGWWSDIERQGKKTLATLNLFKEGLSRTADMVRALIEDGGMRMASSIGFVPDFTDGGYELLRDEANEWVTGIRFLRSILIEASVVVVPANPGALQARSLDIAKRLGGIAPERVSRFVISPASQQLLRQMPARDTLARAAAAVQKANVVLERG